MKKILSLLIFIFIHTCATPQKVTPQSSIASPITSEKKVTTKVTKKTPTKAATKKSTPTDEASGDDALVDEDETLDDETSKLDEQDSDLDLGEGMDEDDAGFDDLNTEEMDFDPDDLGDMEGLGDFEIDEEALAAEAGLAEPAEGEEVVEPELDMTVNTSVDIPIPFLGTLTLDGTMNLETGEAVLSKKVAEKKLGPITFSNLYIALSDQKGLTGKAQIDVAGRKADAFLNFLRVGEYGLEGEFLFKFKDKFVLPLTPWRIFNIQEWYLHLTQDHKEFYSKLSIEEKDDAKISLGLDDTSYAAFSAKAIRPSSLFPFFDNTEFDKALFRDVLLRVSNPLSPRARGTFIMKMKLDASQLKLPLETDLSKLIANAEVSREDGFYLKATLPDTTLPVIGRLTNAQLLFSNRKPAELDEKFGDKQLKSSIPIPRAFQLVGVKRTGLKPGAYLRLTGTANIKLPQNLGAITTNVRADFQAGRFIFSAALDKKVAFRGVHFSQPHIYMSTDGLIEIVGAGKLGAFEIYAHLQVRQEKGKIVTTFYGTLKDDKPIKPFAKIPGICDIPVLKDVKLGNVTLGVGSDKSIYFDGNTTIFGLESRARFKKTPKAATLWFETPPNFKLSSFIPGTDIPLIKNLTFKRMWIVGSSHDYFDDEHQVEVKRGFSVIADIQATGKGVENLNKMLKIGDKTIKFTATKGKSPKDVYVALIVPTEINMSKLATLKNIAIEVGLLPFAIGGVATLILRPSKKDELLFHAMIKALPAKVLVSGTMKGVWKNPLGIKGFTIQDVAAEVGTLYTSVPPLPIFGLTGMFEVGSKKMGMAYKFSPDLSETIMMGKMNTLGIQDMIDVANKAGAKIPKKLIPDINFRDMEFIFSPGGGSIGKILFDPGLTAKGNMKFLGLTALVNCNIAQDGIVGKGAMSRLKLGPLELTGKGFDEQYGTDDDGPVVNMALNMREQKIFISGRMVLFGTEREVELILTPRGINFTLKGRLMGVFDITYHGESFKVGNKLDFMVSAEMENKFTDFVKSKVIDGISAFQKKISKSFGKAKKKIDGINNAIEEINEEIRAKKNRIGYLKGIIKAKTEAAKGNIRAARKEIEGARNRVGDLDRQIRHKKDRINYLKRIIGKSDIHVPPAYNDLVDTHKFDHQLLFARGKTEKKLSFARPQTSEKLASYSIPEHEKMRELAQPETVKYAAWYNPRDWGEGIAKGATRVADGVRQVYDGARWVVEKGTSRIANGARLVWDGVKWVGEQAYKAAKKAAETAWRAGRYGPEITKLAAEIAALESAKLTAQATLRSIETGLRGTQAVAFDPTSAKEAAEITALGFEIGSLETSKGPIIASRETAKGTLTAVEKSAVGITDVAKFALTPLGELIDIKKMGFNTSVRGIGKGSIVKMRIEAKILGKSKTLTVDFDVKNAAQSTQNIIKSLVKLIKP